LSVPPEIVFAIAAAVYILLIVRGARRPVELWVSVAVGFSIGALGARAGGRSGWELVGGGIAFGVLSFLMQAAPRNFGFYGRSAPARSGLRWVMLGLSVAACVTWLITPIPASVAWFVTALQVVLIGADLIDAAAKRYPG
jgi:hypothetical protein